MRKASSLFNLVLHIIISFLILNTFTIISYARAGGGDSFGGGGFDSGGGGGGSFDFGSGSGSFGSSSGSSFDGDGFGTFIVIMIIIAIILISRRRRGGGSVGSDATNSESRNRNASPGHKTQSESEINDNLKELKKIDSKFDEQKFKSHSKKVFMAVQEGWTKREQKVCRPFMAEEVYQSHQMQIDSMKSNKVVNVLENIVVGSTGIARIDLGEEYHKIAVKMRASMKDYKVKEDNPEKVIEGSKNQSPPFTEFWIFIRRSNLKTKLKDGIFDRKCPNCGAPIKVDVAGICKYCDANVVNGDYDWVLSEIVQRSEWEE